MSIPQRVNQFLTDQQIPYHTLQHPHSQSSVGSALAAKVPMKQVAKAVILEDHQGHQLMAILPTENKVSIKRLNDQFNASYKLVSESNVFPLFQDCEHGAIPPFGSAYNLQTICDEELWDQENIFLEAGDHETLIELDKPAFQKAFKDSKLAHFSRKAIY